MNAASISFATEFDVADIMAIEHECFPVPWTEGAIFGELYNPDTLFFFAAYDDVPAGFCITRKVGKSAELMQIAVTRRFRRHGVARTLLTRLLTELKKQSVTEVYLEVRETNVVALSLYDEFVFERVGLRKDYYQNPVESAVVMRLAIS